MRFYAIIGAEVGAPDKPYLIDAWPEAMVETNPDGWRQAITDEQIGRHHSTAVVIEVPDEQLLPLLHSTGVGPAHAVIRADDT